MLDTRNSVARSGVVAAAHEGGPDLTIEVLAAELWWLLRDVRLRALKDSPEAYLADYDDENRRTEADWRKTFVDATWVVARSDHRVVGLARSVKVADRPDDERHIESVWVDPEFRRAGLMGSFLTYLTSTEADVRTWMLWVLGDNTAARLAYECLDFEPTGERQDLPDGSGRYEERLILRPAGSRTGSP